MTGYTLEALYWDRRTFNCGYIFFDDIKKAKKMKKLLEKLNIKNVTFIITMDGNKYYGFKLLHIRRKIMNICAEMKGVIL